MRRAARALSGVVAAAGLAAVVATAWPGSMVPYLLEQGYFQAELLWGRVPVVSVTDDGRYTEAQRKRLAWIPEIQAYGAKIGLASSENYSTINPDWKRTIYNVSACDPASFDQRAWWFPVVGLMPYLGYFRSSDATAEAALLDGQGYDVYVRTAGAYSTLGWFRDPVLPEMLGWSEQQLAETLLHELTHATLWIPGSAEFNESFANFVGEQAAVGYLIDAHGADSREVKAAVARLDDRKRFSGALHGVLDELDAVYKRQDLSRSDKVEQKGRILGSIPVRVAALDLSDPVSWQRWVRTGTWNNARMLQFRTYNRSPDQFRAVWDAEDHDIRKFIDRIGEITAGARDPYVALAAAAAALPSESSDR